MSEGGIREAARVLFEYLYLRDSERGAADARRLPTLDLEASVAHRSSVPEAVFPESIPDIGGFVLFPDIRNTYRAGVVLTQPVWTGGAISSNRDASRHEAAAAAAEAARVDDDLRFEARTAYWSAVAADAALDAARSEVERAARLLDDALALRDAGMAVRADELGAEARLAAARVRVTCKAELAASWCSSGLPFSALPISPTRTSSRTWAAAECGSSTPSAVASSWPWVQTFAIWRKTPRSASPKSTSG